MVKKRSKKYVNMLQSVKTGAHNLNEAIDCMVNNFAVFNFDQTIDLVLNFSPKIQIRGIAELPNGCGKVLKIAVFTNSGEKYPGADFVGGEELIDKVVSEGIMFDKCIATPDIVPILSKKLSKILGPRGIMPNAKLGTVTNDVFSMISKIRSATDFRSTKFGVVQVGVGKLNFGKDKLIENISAFMSNIKNNFSDIDIRSLNSVYISCTMSPSVSIICSDILK